MKETHQRQLFRALYDAAEKVTDRQQKTGTQCHRALAAGICHLPPDGRHDGGYEKAGRKDDAGPQVNGIFGDAEFSRQIHGQKGNEHGVARGHEEYVDGKYGKNDFPVQEQPPDCDVSAEIPRAIVAPADRFCTDFELGSIINACVTRHLRGARIS